jgi:hypothetical protein
MAVGVGSELGTEETPGELDHSLAGASVEVFGARYEEFVVKRLPRDGRVCCPPGAGGPYPGVWEKPVGATCS